MIVPNLLVLLALFQGAWGSFYLPGVTPSHFNDGEKVVLKTNKVTSTKTPLQYDYYDLPFCKGKRSVSRADNIGERLSGDSVTTSPYELRMKQDEACVVLCRKKYKRSDITMFKSMIDQEYRVHWLLDNLPVAVRNDELGYVSRGYPIGFIASVSDSQKAKHYLFNHVRIIARYNEDTEAFSGSRIVGFEVIPFSIKHEYDSETFTPTTILNTCNQFHPAQYNPSIFQPVELNDEEVIYTYDVKWERSEVPWSHRWDVYFKGNPDDEIHYFSIVNSLLIVLFLTGVVAMIMLRTLHKDISTYNEINSNIEEQGSETGWKLVAGDVFRSPENYPMLLAVCTGSGVQVLAMTSTTMVCALFGLTSPANRGALLTTLLLLFVFMGSFAGYTSARIYKLFGGQQYYQSTALTALFYPGLMAVIFIAINIFVASQGSSTATPFSTLVALLLLWFGVSTPLVYIGSYFGFRKETISIPVKKINIIKREIPDQVWYTHPLFSIALGGILPFGAVCIELFFIMSAMWLHQIYLVFGFLFVVLLILIITCAEITIVMCYFQLCNEDWKWWWRSFLSAGSSGVYLLLYSVWYYASKLKIEGFVPTVLYFSYMSMVSFTFFLLTGTIGFFSCLWFTRKIYGAIKVD